MEQTYKNYFEVLGIPLTASNEEISAAFDRRISQHYADPKKVERPREWLEQIEQITEAYDNLHDQLKRESHILLLTRLKALRGQQEQEQKQQTTVSDTETENARPGGENKDPEKTAESLVEEKTAAPEPIVNETALPKPAVRPPQYDDVIDAEALALLQKKLPDYLAAKKELQLLNSERRVEAGGKKVGAFSLPLAALYTVLLGALGWLAYGFATTDFKSSALQVSAQKVMADSLSARVRDSIKRETIDSSLIEDIKGFYIVTAPKTLFYEKPLAGKETSYPLLKGYKFIALKRYKNFLFTVFQSRFDKNATMEGWIPEADVRPYQLSKKDRLVRPVIKNYQPYKSVFRDSSLEVNKTENTGEN